MNEFVTRAAESVLVGDGAMGTMLHAVGHAYDGSLAALNLTHPDVVVAIHKSYVAAGADVIQTNSFGASRLRLTEHGHGADVREINMAAGKIAREAAHATKRKVFVAGSVSPAVTGSQRLQVSSPDRIYALREQLEALCEAGVELFILETFGHVEELVEAVATASEFHLPIIAQATFTEACLTLSGHTATDLAIALNDLTVSAVGVNCTVGPRKLVSVVTELATATNLPLSVQPNAGQPEYVASKEPVRFAVDGDYFASFVPKFVEAGAVLIGGCCGTTPSMIAKIAEAARSCSPARTVVLSSERASTRPSLRLRQSAQTLSQRLGHSEFVVAVELAAPAAGTGNDQLALARRLKDRGVDLFIISPEDKAGALSRSAVLANSLRDRLHLEPIISVATLDKSALALQAEMLGVYGMDIHNILCDTTGSLIIGDYPTKRSSRESDSMRLIALLDGLNRGQDCAGQPLALTTEFVVGALCNISHHTIEFEISRTLQNVGAGARFLVTRPTYDSKSIQCFRDGVATEKTPILATIRPLQDEEEAAYLYHEVPDIDIPRESVDALHEAGFDAPRCGVELAQDVMASIRPFVNGFVISSGASEPLESLLETALELRVR